MYWTYRLGTKKLRDVSYLVDNFVEDNFRYNLSGIQASFRRGTNDEYLTLVGSDIDSITDNIPQGTKTISAPPYVLSAPSSGQRPSISGSNGAMVFDPSNSETLRGDSTGLEALMDGGEAHTVYVVANEPASANQTWWFVGDSASNSSYITMYRRNGPEPAYSQRQTAFTECTGSFAGSGPQVICGVYEGGTNADALIYVTGSLAGGPTTQTSMTNTANRFSLGVLDRASPANFLNGDIYEVLVCVGVAHDASTVAEVTAQLEAEYNL